MEADRPDLPAGTVLGDRFRVEARVAGGGFGVVYRARDERGGRPVAVKVLHAELGDNRSAVARFEREARVINLIRHPNVVELLDFGQTHGGSPYFVMELLEGETVAARVARRRMAADEALAVLEPLCAALDAAHDKGVIHRDIKASNVFLAREGGALGPPRVVLLDFGVAKLLDDTRAPLTRSREAVGTLACMAPEQITGAPVDERADVYALGILAFHMLTGTLPFSHDIIAAIEDMHLHMAPPRPSRRAPMPEALDAVIARALAKDPDDRPDDAMAFVAAFRAALAGEPATAPPRAAPGGDRAGAMAVAVYAQLTVADDIVEDIERLERVEAALSALIERLGAAGLSPLSVTANAALLIANAPGDAAADRRVPAPIARAMQLAHADAQAALGSDASLSVIAHVGEEDAARRISTWLAAIPPDGVFVTNGSTSAIAPPPAAQDGRDEREPVSLVDVTRAGTTHARAPDNE